MLLRETAPLFTGSGAGRIENPAGSIVTDIALGDALPSLAARRNDTVFLAPAVGRFGKFLDRDEPGVHACRYKVMTLLVSIPTAID